MRRTRELKVFRAVHIDQLYVASDLDITLKVSRRRAASIETIAFVAAVDVNRRHARMASAPAVAEDTISTRALPSDPRAEPEFTPSTPAVP